MLLESPVLYLVSLYGDESAREGGRGKVRYARLSLSVCVTARACGCELVFECVRIGFSRVLRTQESYKSVTLLLFVLLMCVWIKRNLVSSQGKCFMSAYQIVLNALLYILLGKSNIIHL